MQKKPLVILTGPTAVGKTFLSIMLAKKINGSIISADSMQVYKGMDIGTAKIKPNEMNGIDHYLIDILNPDQEFNVVKFQHLSKMYMEKIYSKGKIPIIVGGTGFYIQSILYDIDFTKENKNNIRLELESYLEKHGKIALYNILQEIDKESADKIHYNNTKKVIRAIEFYKQTGNKISKHNEMQKEKTSPYNYKYFVLNKDRKSLYDLINLRVDIMIEKGLVNEVKGLLDKGYSKDLVSMQGLGYKEIIPYINNDYTLEEAIYILKRDTRRFAKRQITWFKREKDLIWIDKDSYKNELEIVDYIADKLLQSNIMEEYNDRS